jgi:hypothetical protein
MTIGHYKDKYGPEKDLTLGTEKNTIERIQWT